MPSHPQRQQLYASRIKLQADQTNIAQIPFANSSMAFDFCWNELVLNRFIDLLLMNFNV
jgi:hypothetical protein